MENWSNAPQGQGVMMVQEYYSKRDFFDEKAARWHTPDSDQQSLDTILPMLNLPHSGLFLDVGCGTGILFAQIKQIRPNLQVIGIDLSMKMLEQCSKKHSQPVLSGLAENLPFAGETFDVIMNYCSYPHIVNKRSALHEYYRVLKPGGRFFILHPKGRKEIDTIHHKIGGPVGHDHLCPVDRIFSLLPKEGLTPVIGMDRENVYLVEAIKV